MSLAYYRAERPKTLSDVVKWMPEREYSIESYTLLAGSGADREVQIGTPLGQITAAGEKVAQDEAAEGNAGGGSITLGDPAFTDSVKLGTYTITCTVAGGDATAKFRVEDPDGVFVGTATSGSAFSKQIKFTIAHAETNWAVGDTFYVTVSIEPGEDDGKVAEWDPTATDGRQHLWGFAANAVTAAKDIDNIDGGLAIRRMAILRDGGIRWPEGLSADQKAAAIAEAEKRGILIRV